MAECKDIPGNIGLLKSKISIYEHNPFWARPYQNITFPFTELAGAEITSDPHYEWDHRPNEKNTKDKQNVVFQFGQAFLQPLNLRFCNFVATIHDTTQLIGRSVPGQVVRKLDIVKGMKSSSIIASNLPNSDPNSVYNSPNRVVPSRGKYNFPHLLFIYEGSAIYNTTIMNPSEYATPIAAEAEGKNLEELQANQRQKLLSQLGTALWDLTSETNPKDIFDVIYPVMVGRRTCQSCDPIHWTLRKYTPMYQGQDFSIRFNQIDSATDEFKMTGYPYAELGGNSMKLGEEGTPFFPFFEPAHKGFTGYPVDSKLKKAYENGVSNIAYYSFTDTEEGGQNHIRNYYLKNKAYIMIEVGSGLWNNPHDDSNRKVGHNYFIEMIKGKKPRFLHFGYDLRGFDGEGPDGIEGKADDSRIKLRVLSEFDLSFDELLSKEQELKIQIRNHMGDIIITFNGVEQPWRISRTDFVRDNNKKVVEKRVPMVIPNGTMKIHGGNMTVGIMYGPLIYEERGQVVFRDRQADLGKARDEEIYATFARPGDNDTDQAKPRMKAKKFFTDRQFDNLKMGYDADAYEVNEIHKNLPAKINIYQIFSDNYQKFGRQWAYPEDKPQTEGPFWLAESPSRLSIRVVRNYDEEGLPKGLAYKFNLDGISQDAMGSDGQYIGLWDVAIDFEAGSLSLPPVSPESFNLGRDEIPSEDMDGNFIGRGENRVLLYNVTPVAPAWSLVVLGGEKVIKEDMEEDISEFVETISDGWTSEEYTSINHETNLQLYLPISTGTAKGDEKVGKILSLIDKTFFVTISYWWADGMGLNRSIQTAYSKKSDDYDPAEDPRLIQMTGIAYGAEVNRSVNKIRMNIAVKDYMEPLKQAFVWNCPFFDSVSDTNAIYELVKMAGFDNSVENHDDVPGQQGTKGIDRRPLGFIRELTKTRVKGLKDPVIWNEERHVHDYFALPGSYADINNPVMKFSNGTPYKDIIDKIVKLYGKTVYFDRYGVMIVEVSPAKLTAFARAKTDTSDPDSPLFDPDINALIKAAFVTSPRLKIWNIDDEKFVKFDPEKDTPFIVYNVAKIKRNVADSINSIGMMSATAPDQEKTGFMIKGRTFYDQIWDPEAEGFFGYRKMLWHQEGIYGNDQSMNSAMTQYARMKYPPFQVSFEAYGTPGLKPLDIIMLDRQPLYITEINHDLDPKTNMWWMNISAEWIKSFDEKLLLPSVSEEDLGKITA